MGIKSILNETYDDMGTVDRDGTLSTYIHDLKVKVSYNYFHSPDVDPTITLNSVMVNGSDILDILTSKAIDKLKSAVDDDL